MKIAIYIADKPREHFLAKCITEGAQVLGDEAITFWRQDFQHPLDDIDVACVMGVKSNANWFIEEHLKAGKHVLYFDKGYVRETLGKSKGGWLYWRVAVDGHQPTSYFRKIAQSSNRWDDLRIKINPKFKKGESILYASSSQKFCNFYRLGDATEYATKLIKEISKHSESKIIYRPKPSWRHATSILGSVFSRPPEKIYDAMVKSKVMITYGSNAVFEATIVGMPTVVVGNAITYSISEHRVSNINNPYVPSANERYSLLSDLAYCQWKMSEFSSGVAWQHVRNIIEDMKDA